MDLKKQPYYDNEMVAHFQLPIMADLFSVFKT